MVCIPMVCMPMVCIPMVCIPMVCISMVCIPTVFIPDFLGQFEALASKQRITEIIKWVQEEIRLAWGEKTKTEKAPAEAENLQNPAALNVNLTAVSQMTLKMKRMWTTDCKVQLDC